MIYMSNWAVVKTDAPAGFHISYNGKTAEAILAKIFIDPTDPKQTKRQPKDILPVPTPQSRYADNAKLVELNLVDKIIPRPYSMVETGGPLRIELSDIKIVADDELENEVKFLNQFFKTMLGKFPTEEHRRVYLSIDPNLDVDNDGKVDAESYHFYTKPDSGIVIVGADKAVYFTVYKPCVN